MKTRILYRGFISLAMLYFVNNCLAQFDGDGGNIDTSDLHFHPSDGGGGDGGGGLSHTQNQYVDAANHLCDLGDPQYDLGNAASANGNYALAEIYFQQALAYYRQAYSGYPYSDGDTYRDRVVNALVSIASAEAHQKHFLTALDYERRAVHLDPLPEYYESGSYMANDYGDKKAALEWLQAAYDHTLWLDKRRKKYKAKIAKLQDELDEERLNAEQAEQAQLEQEGAVQRQQQEAEQEAHSVAAMRDQVGQFADSVSATPISGSQDFQGGDKSGTPTATQGLDYLGGSSAQASSTDGPKAAGEQLMSAAYTAKTGGDLTENYDIGNAENAGSLDYVKLHSFDIPEAAKNDRQLNQMVKDYDALQAKQYQLESGLDALAKKRDTTKDADEMQKLTDQWYQMNQVVQANLMAISDQKQKIHREIDCDVSGQTGGSGTPSDGNSGSAQATKSSNN